MTTTRMLSIWKEDEDNPLTQEGLYIALSPEGSNRSITTRPK